MSMSVCASFSYILGCTCMYVFTLEGRESFSSTKRMTDPQHHHHQQRVCARLASRQGRRLIFMGVSVLAAMVILIVGSFNCVFVTQVKASLL